MKSSRKADPLETSPVIWIQGYSSITQRIQSDHSNLLTLFLIASKGLSFGVRTVWKQQKMWKMGGSSSGKHITTTDAALFATDMVTNNLVLTLRKSDHGLVQTVTDSRIGLIAIGGRGQSEMQVVE